MWLWRITLDNSQSNHFIKAKSWLEAMDVAIEHFGMHVNEVTREFYIWN